MFQVSHIIILLKVSSYYMRIYNFHSILNQTPVMIIMFQNPRMRDMPKKAFYKRLFVFNCTADQLLDPPRYKI